MTPTVTIRPAYPDDERALMRLAALDSQRLPDGPFLLAEIDGVPRAAIAIPSGRTFSDPFVATAELVELLRRRHAQLAQRAIEETSLASRQSRPQLAAAREPSRVRLSRRRPSARLGGRAAEA
jgi:hypothetical protein